MNKIIDNAWLQIDLTKIKPNLEAVRNIIPSQTKIMGIVKDNAYGHGDIEVSKELIKQGVDFLAVSNVEEGIKLRKALGDIEILVLSYVPQANWELLIKYNLIATIVSFEHAQNLNEFAKANNTKLRTHIKVDTGMSRVGIRYSDSEKPIAQLISIFNYANLSVEGIFSHFSVSDDLSPKSLEYTNKQIELYDELVSELRVNGINKFLTHLQNTYGILNYNNLAYDYVRPGLLHLGVTSRSDVDVVNNLALQPILSLKAKINLIKEVPAGTMISYGCNHCTSESTKIATVSIGYGDGLTRALSNKGLEVLINGQRAIVVGNICMDQLMVDVTNIECSVEDEVIFIGQSGTDHLDVDQLAIKANTINNDIFCMFNQRLNRYYNSEEEHENL